MSIRHLTTVIGIIAGLALISCTSDTTQGQNAELQTSESAEPEREPIVLSEEQLVGIVEAPDFPNDLEWLNTGFPLAMAQLRGKVVLLDFWTFCCINCMHVLPELALLEEKYEKDLFVIGVHSAKFTNEQSTEAIREAVLRYDIKHPVINDKDFKVWNQYGIRAWPSFVLINPDGNIIGTHSGEGIYDLFDQIIGQTISYFDQQGKLKEKNFIFTPESRLAKQHLLKYPGKVASTPDGKLIITDSNNNRLLIVRTDGQIETVIGSGKQGQLDGSFTEAQFNKPQGVVLDGDRLYIADTENHTIRVADLDDQTVKTVLGTGQQARRQNVSGKGVGVALNSPWDLLVDDDELYIAMAGSHQLWVADLDSWEARPYAGSAAENITDGKLLAATLAQPSGITTDGDKLFFADSETSSIRSADLDREGSVETIIGEGLFEYGDIDGSYPEARLQHPLGVVFKDGLLYVADTYNHKIKIVDPGARTSTTLAGTGKRGFADGGFAGAEFDEPSGLAFVGGRLYVADANNHQVRVLDLESRMVSSLELKNITLLADQTMDNFSGRVIETPRRALHTGKASISFGLNIPEGYELNAEAPFYIDFHSSNEKIVGFTKTPDEVVLDQQKLLFEIPMEVGKGMAEITVDAVVYMCDKKSGLCVFDNLRVLVRWKAVILERACLVLP
jgi:DNA-binding beta-propeller fold protein YncE